MPFPYQVPAHKKERKKTEKPTRKFCQNKNKKQNVSYTEKAKRTKEKIQLKNPKEKHKIILWSPLERNDRKDTFDNFLEIISIWSNEFS